MKNRGSTLFKISGILAIVLGAILCAVSLFTFFITLAFGIPIIIGGNRIMNMADLSNEEIEQNKTAIIGWSIFFLIVGTISGVLSLIGLIMCESSSNQSSQTQANLNEQKTQSQNNNENIHVYNENEPSRMFENKAEKLERLLSLKERGILTEEEFKSLKEKTLKED